MSKITEYTIKKKTIYAKIGLYQQEYSRLGKQIKQLEAARAGILKQLKDELEEASNIADYLLEKEYEFIMNKTINNE